MNPDLTNIKNKLVKLINLSENSAASQGEIDNALNAAAQIMARHNLTREDIDLTNQDPAKNVRMSRAMVQCLNRNSTTWEAMLARFCTEFVSSIGYYKSQGYHGLNKANKICCYFFYGSKDEVEIAVELFRELQSAISIMAVTRYDNFYSKQGGAYCEGFVSGLEQSNHLEKLKLRGDSQTNALMIRSNETSLLIIDKAKDWLADCHRVKLKTGQGTRGASDRTGDARTQGKLDGSNYSVTKKTISKKLN
jgi:hypothetical protein